MKPPKYFIYLITHPHCLSHFALLWTTTQHTVTLALARTPIHRIYAYA